ncbi:MAG: hypothetical protein DRR06_01260 [Gammaproteobacteria bacterium]|nr:MAG: hypothetical protein DRR06_01260 [Gammaproteobacteria bacterium]
MLISYSLPYRALIACIVVCVFACASVQAATVQQADTGQIIAANKAREISEEIVVTGTRSPYSIAQVAATVRIIDSETIARSGARNVTELLRNYGSVQVRDSMGNGRDTQLGLRGYSGSSNALVLVDGRKLNNSDLGSQDLTAVTIGEIERVEILEGGAGALYGDQAVGGVINIITKGRATKGGYVLAGAGSYDNENYAASYSNQLDNGWFYHVNGEYEKGDGYRDDTNTDYKNYNGKLGYAYGSGSGSGSGTGTGSDSDKGEGEGNGNGAGAVFIEARENDNDYRLTGALLAAQVDEDRRQAGSSFNDYKIDTSTVRFGIDHRFNDVLQLLTTYSDRDEDVTIKAASSFGDSKTKQSRRVKTVDPRLIFSLDRWRLTVGVDVEHVDYDFDIDFGFGSSRSAHENRKTSEYAQLFYSLSEQLVVQAGIRHAKLDSDVDPFDIDYDQSRTVHQLGAIWTADNWRVFLNWDEMFRFPLVDENIDFFGTVNMLDVQHGESWELGGERQWRQLSARLSLFQQDNHDEIGFDPALGFFGANTNFDDTRRRGGTMDVDWEIDEQWSIRALYTYIDARFTQGPYKDNRLPNVARELVKAQVNYQPLSELGLVVEWVYTGSQTLDLSNSAGSLGGYTVTNLIASYQLQNWTLRARLNNITDKKYTEFVTFFGAMALYPSPERNLMATLSYSF